LSRFEQLGLWTRNINPDGASDEGARERLRSSYRQFWANAVALSREIQRDLPQLTLHDDAHFEALWERADQIAGDGYRLTPLEVFVFGGAILLHDAANALAAFPGGLEEVQSTPEWRDAKADYLQNCELEESSPIPEDATRGILLETLRSIHAERARSLASFEVNAGERRFALLQDDQLRTHLGSLIGEIAASHHWDISTLQQRLGGPRGSLAGMPTTWTVRPVLLACLLRCSDATQIDHDRAPDFLYGLLRLHGISEQHWRAQNRLAHPLIDGDDVSALVFTSTQAFREHDATAWWIAHDAIQVAHRELQASDSLIKDLRLSPFQVNRIRGAESPSRLAAYLLVEGWRPVAAEVKASRIEKIVDMFGGEKLYGHQMAVPIRELIQNAADAIRFRRELEPASSTYDGRITVRLRVKEPQKEYIIEVDDDGIGMSEAVMIGPLIDFGASYVSSSLVKAERPGLLSKGRKRIGKFGVGFFSSFMITGNVEVVSKPFDAGVEACRTLRFTDGSITRPILLERRPSDFSALLSTRVSLNVSDDVFQDILIFDSPFRGEPRRVSFIQLVGALCPMLDADVFVEDNGNLIQVHYRKWFEGNRSRWISQISLPEESKREGLIEEIDEASGRLTFVDPSDPSAGLASIAGVAGTGVTTVGTLRATDGLNQFENEYFGAIDYEPAGPRRSRGNVRAAARLPDWASEQANLAAAKGIPLPQRQLIAQRVAQFGGNAAPIASIRSNRDWIGLEEAFNQAIEKECIYIPVTAAHGNKNRWLMTIVRQHHSGFIDNYLSGELEYIHTTWEGSDSSGTEEYYAVPHDNDPAEHSFLNMINFLAAHRGYQVQGDFIQKADLARYVGENSPRQQLQHGMLIGCGALKLTVWAIAN